MVQSLSNFTRNAPEMPKTPLANAIVELNHKKKFFHVYMIGTVLRMEDVFKFLKGLPVVVLPVYNAVFYVVMHKK